ncbi:MAG: class I SAM-dependent methyltransferase [Rubrobacteraceae bacterium]
MDQDGTVTVLDKAGKSYWDENWSNYELPAAVNVHRPGLEGYVERRLHEYFQTAFAAFETEEMSLLEIGCARSSWLPYFAKEFGFEVSGIDYSEVGCAQARQILENEGVGGEIVCADFFSPPEDMQQAFDVIVSFGVVEHFEQTDQCIESLSKFLKPVGTMITLIPNLSGLLGKLQKIINAPAYNVHVPLSRKDLFRAHADSGLEVQSCDYFMIGGFTVINLENLRTTPFYKSALRLRSLFSKMAWKFETSFRGLAPNRQTSPYVICTARKP